MTVDIGDSTVIPALPAVAIAPKPQRRWIAPTALIGSSIAIATVLATANRIPAQLTSSWC